MIYRYNFYSSKESLKGIRTFVADTLLLFNLTEIITNQLVLATDEICANLIIHAHQTNENDPLELSIENKKNKIIFEITDKSDVPFDLKNYKQPDILEIVKQRKKGGVGLMLVNSVMDTFEIKKKENYSIWRLSKNIPVPQRITIQTDPSIVS